MVSLIAGLKMQGIVKWRGLKSQGPLYKQCASIYIDFTHSIMQIMKGKMQLGLKYAY